MVLNITSGALLPAHLTTDVDAPVAWGGSPDFLYYARMDDTGRPYQLWQRQLSPTVLVASSDSAKSVGKAGKKRKGSKRSDKGGGFGRTEPAGDSKSSGAEGPATEERLLFEESDRRFRLRFARNRAGTSRSFV